MARRYKLITELYERTQKSVAAPDKWQEFLSSACQNYKLPFDEQLLIYAQRPDATAVLEIEKWNRLFGRWVNRGATGIAVFNKDFPNANRLKYYFDISDTHESRLSRTVPIWEVEKMAYEEITEALENSFGEVSKKEDFADVLILVAQNACRDNAGDYISEIYKIRENSFLEELDELNVSVICQTLIENSVGYMLLKRCGLDPGKYFDDEDFREITQFNTREVLNAVGVATGDISKMCLSEIARTVMQMQRENQNRTLETSRGIDDNAVRGEKVIDSERRKEDERHFIQQHKRDENTEPASGRDRESSPWEIRTAQSKLSEKGKEDPLHESAYSRQTQGSSFGNSGYSNKENAASNREDGKRGGTDREPEGKGSDEVGRSYDEYQDVSRREYTKGSDLQLTEEAGTDDENAGRNELPAFLDEALIMKVISNEKDDLKYRKEQIELFFSLHKDRKERAEYIKSAYHDRYTEIHIGDKRVGYRPQEDGLLIWEGSYLSRTSESVFSWQVACEWIEQLILKKKYLKEKNIRNLKTEDSKQLSFFDVANADFKQSIESVPRGNTLKLPGSLIDEALCIGSNDKNSRLIISAYFMKDKSIEENARFLRDFYGENGAGFYYQGDKVSIWYDENGVRIGYGESVKKEGVILSWEQAAKRIRELLDMGRYMPERELLQAPSFERKGIADSLWYLRQDFSEEARGKFLPVISSIYEKRQGFSEESRQIAELLETEENINEIMAELSEFNKAYEEKPDILRFSFHKPKDILSKLSDLKREGVTFKADEKFQPKRDFFITVDEVEHLLKGDKKEHDYRLGLYAEYLRERDKTSIEKFLKHRYGEYRGYAGGNDQYSYSGKGLQFSHGRATEPYAKVQLSWKQITSIIEKQIIRGDFLSEEDIKNIPFYERRELAKRIYVFFSREGKEVPKPYPDGFEFWDGVKVIELQLLEKEKTEKIKEQMLSVVDNSGKDSKEYELKKSCLEDISKYINGEFTLFEREKVISPFSEKLSADEKPEDTSLLDEVSSHLLDEGIAASDEVIEKGIEDAAMEIGENTSKDIAIHIKKELLREEEESKGEENIEELSQKRRAKKIHFELIHPEVPREERIDFHIEKEDLHYGSKSEKYQANIAAISTLKQIESEDRLANGDEQKILSKYTGWGGLSEYFDERNGRYLELKNLLTEEEYISERASSLTSFYTAPEIIEGIYKALSQMGFERGNVLEPSCGIGNFIGMLPDSMKESKVYGVEIDSVSGRISRQLYQNSHILIDGYENADIPGSFFDIALGNVPFGDFKVTDKKYDKHNFLIHDYFFGKTLDKVRPGGIIAFITSKGTMDKENSSVRRYIAQRADLIGVIRLPDNAFYNNAGTEVTSDIIFLQKREYITDIEPDWVHLATDKNGIRQNAYFVSHPDMVLGEMVMKSGRFGIESTCRAYEDVTLSELLSEAVQNLHAEIIEVRREDFDEEDLSIPADPDVRNFSYCTKSGKIYFRENSRMHPVELSVTAENRVRGMIKIRDSVRKLILYQSEDYPESEIRKEQENLNTIYDNYTKKYGLLSSRGNSLAFSEDVSYCLLCSLEILDDEGNLKRKADMFTKRTIRPHKAVSRVDTASEALAVSISEKAKVDMKHMKELSGKSEGELEEELTGVVFRDIYCSEKAEDILDSYLDSARYSFVTADEYLSGNVRKKLRMARALKEALPPEKKKWIDVNIKALEKVQPAELTAAEIGVRIGANWVPIEIYEEFIFELLGTNSYARRRMKILCPKCSGQWNISEKRADRSNVKAFTTYGTKRMDAYSIFEQTLNQKDVRVFDYIEDENGNKKAVLNKKETAIAQDRQELIKAKFSEWIWKDIDRRERLCRIYNEVFNAIRPREYNGEHINFIGMNPEITLRKHQVNAIAHIMYGGNTLLAHEVGAGKTFEMVAAAMEMKRLGLCTKSLIVVPNHIIEQWASEWLQLYPTANILVATKKDFEKRNRKKFCGRISTGDFDAVIIGHSQFEKIPMSAERQITLIQRQMDEIMEGIKEAKNARAERYTVKQLEKTRKSLEAKLSKLNDQSRKDDLVTFEELGVDRIFIDESHAFKNLFLATKMRNVGGIAQTEAQKSSDLFMKTQYMDELTNGHGVIFATGTPISNSMVELYTIQRYLQYSTLQELNLLHFDDWASNFGETITAMELSPEGTGYRAKTRFAKFYNLPELMAIFRQVADIQTADMLNLPVPKANFHTEVISPTQMQKEMIKGLAERAEKIRSGSIDPSVDNMLKVTNDGRKLALDMRLTNPLAGDDEHGKTSTCANNIYRIWKDNMEAKSTQLVFCDLSTPKNDGNFNVYDDIKKKLVEKEIPEEEIAYIHQANTETKKKELFSKVRTGQVRILMGSTQKMGAGTNVQDRLIGLHDLDCPWRPSDLAQRLGRIVRQGNENGEVEIYRYVTEGTFDAYLYQLVENKQKFIRQIMSGKIPVRAMEDVDETALSFAEIKALATGNPLIIEKCNLDMEVGKLNMLKASFLNQKYAMEELVLRRYPETIKRLSERISCYEKDLERVANNPKPKEGFAGMVLNGKKYIDKEEAGKKILELCTRLTREESSLSGEYRGFKLTLSYDSFSNEYRMHMKGQLSHIAVLGSDVYGNITRMDNVLDGFSEKLQKVKDELSETKIQLENAKEEMDSPFTKEEELKEKTERLKELNILLNMDQKDKSLIDNEPEEDMAKETKSIEYER